MPKKTFYLPDFIIIGANKAGTTSVANYLNMNPQVKISEVKEPMFFSSSPATVSASRENADLANPYVTITLEAYSNMFKEHGPKARFFGEASTAYLATPHASVIAMKKVVPETKIIAILREPVSRAISAYKMCLGNGIEERSFSEIVQQAEQQKQINVGGHSVKEYIRNGLYSQLLQPYFQYFDQSQLLVLDYHQLQQSPQDFMQQVADFIGVDYHPVNYNKKYNLQSEHVGGEVVIEESDKQRLKTIFEDEINALQDLVSFNLSHWRE